MGQIISVSRKLLKAHIASVKGDSFANRVINEWNILITLLNPQPSPVLSEDLTRSFGLGSVLNSLSGVHLGRTPGRKRILAYFEGHRTLLLHLYADAFL